LQAFLLPTLVGKRCGTAVGGKAVGSGHPPLKAAADGEEDETARMMVAPAIVFVK